MTTIRELQDKLDQGITLTGTDFDTIRNITGMLMELEQLLEPVLGKDPSTISMEDYFVSLHYQLAGAVMVLADGTIDYVKIIKNIASKFETLEVEYGEEPSVPTAFRVALVGLANKIQAQKYMNNNVMGGE